MSAPDPTQQAPKPVEPSKKQRVLAAIADALAAYGSLSAGVAPRPMATAGLYGRRQKEAEDREAERYAKARAAAESDKQSALLEYQRLQQQHKEAVDAAQEAADKAEKLRQDKVVSSRFIAEQESINARQKAQFEHDKELAELRGELKVKEIQAKPAKEPKAPKSPTDVAKQRKKAEEVMKFLAEAKSGIAQQVAAGLATDDVRRRLQAEMDARNLDGEDRQMVINFFAKHIQPILKAQEDRARIGG